MTRFKPYRWIKCVFGARSFARTSTAGRSTMYVLVEGHSQAMSQSANELFAAGYREEWPKFESERQRHERRE